MVRTLEKSLVYLTGFTGCGKSTVGPLVAELFGMEFVDLDRLIEDRFQKPIPLILRDEGERVFRLAEVQILQEIARIPGRVVALGAGTLITPISREIVQKTGILIYLMATPEDVFQRVRYTNKRILFEFPGAEERISDEELFHRIYRLMEARRPYYEMADIFVDTSQRSIEEIVQKIALALENLEVPKNLQPFNSS